MRYAWRHGVGEPFPRFGSALQSLGSCVTALTEHIVEMEFEIGLRSKPSNSVDWMTSRAQQMLSSERADGGRAAAS